MTREIEEAENTYREFDIMFEDLKENIQQELLEFWKVTDASELNYDYIPICTLYTEDSED